MKPVEELIKAHYYCECYLIHFLGVFSIVTLRRFYRKPVELSFSADILLLSSQVKLFLYSNCDAA